MLKLEDVIHFENDDYQNRIESGSYPKSNIPDNVMVFEELNNIFIEALFKNTEEQIAYNWLENYLGVNHLEFEDIVVSQDGDYHNDWVLASAKLNR